MARVIVQQHKSQEAVEERDGCRYVQQQSSAGMDVDGGTGGGMVLLNRTVVADKIDGW